MTYRLPATKAYRQVCKIFELAGFKPTKDDYDWNTYWGKLKSRLKGFILREMNPYMKINHWPGCWKLGRKDNLYRFVSKLKLKHWKAYSFIPKTYLTNVDADW